MGLPAGAPACYALLSCLQPDQTPSVTADDTRSIEGRNPKPPMRQERIPQAILYMLGAGATFAISSAISKWLVATYPVGEVLFARNAVSLSLFSAFILPTLGLSVLRTRRLGSHVMRSTSQFFSQSLLLIAFSMMPLASATAINFSSPLFATLASLAFLKEPVGPARWTALGLGFLGVLIVTNPGAETFQVGAIYALGNAILFGTVTAGVRGMTSTESTETLTIYQLLLLSCFYAVTLPFAFAVPTWMDFLLMAANGGMNLIGQYWWTRSLHLAPTSAVVPFQYLSLIWAMLLGYAVWGDMPTLGLVVGSAVVVGSGIFLLWYEARHAPPKAKRQADPH